MRQPTEPARQRRARDADIGTSGADADVGGGERFEGAIDGAPVGAGGDVDVHVPGR